MREGDNFAAKEIENQIQESKEHAEHFMEIMKKAEKRFAALAKVEERHAKAYEDKVQATKNAVKPRVSANVSPQQGESPLMRANAFANGRSKELDAIALREMREAQMRS